MSSPGALQSNVSERTINWLEDQNKLKRSPVYRKKFRAAAARSQLAEITNNPKLRRPKASAASRIRRMPDLKLMTTRQRAGKKADKKQDEVFEDNRTDSSSVGVHTPYELAPSGSSSYGKTRPKSPIKRSVKEIGQFVSNAEVDIPFLKQCKPSLKIESYNSVIDRKKIPSMVKDLWCKIQGVDGVLPRELKVCYHIHTRIFSDSSS